jgi:pilus assembly protein Flp/PilA
MSLKLQEFLHDESGAAAIEFGLIFAGLCVAVITLAGQMNLDLKPMFERMRDMLRSFNLQAMA